MNQSHTGFSVRTVWAIPLVVSSLAGWLAWEIGPESTAAKRTAHAEEQWILPPVPVQDLKKASEYLSAANIWGNVDVVKKEDLQRDPAWRLLATMVAGGEKYVLIDVEKQPNRQLKVGDKLPGGAEIHDIRQDSLCVIINGKKRILPVFPRDRQIL